MLLNIKVVAFYLNFCLKKIFVQHIFKALFTKKKKKNSCVIRAEAKALGRSKNFLHQKLPIVICNNFCLRKFFVQCIFKVVFAKKLNCAIKAVARPVGRFCSYAIPVEHFIT